MSTWSSEGLELAIEREYVEVTPSREPDPTWLYVDAAGHRHRWRGGHLPTLEDVPVGLEWSGCLAEYVTATELRCRRCGEPVEPGYRVPSVPSYLPGRITHSGRMAQGHPDFERLGASMGAGEWVPLVAPGGRVRFEALATNLILGEEILFMARNVQGLPGEGIEP